MKWKRWWSVLILFDKLKSSFSLDFKFILISQQISVICKNTVVSCPRNWNYESSVHVINKLKFQTETHWFAKFPSQLNVQLLSCDSNVWAFWEVNFYIDTCNIIHKLAFKITVFVTIVYYFEIRRSLNSQRYNWHDNLSFIEEDIWKWGSTFHDDINIFEWLCDFFGVNKEGKFVIIVAYLIRIETDFNLKLLFRFYFSFILWDFKNALFLDLSVIDFPWYFVLINILNKNRHEFWITSIGFGNNFSFEIYNGRLKDELGFDGVTWKEGRVIDFDWFLDSHWNAEFIDSCLFWIKLNLKVVQFLWFYY